MKTQPLLITVLGVAILLLWIQARQNTGELEALRAGQPSAFTQNADAQRSAAASTEPLQASTAPGEEETLAAAHVRIANLEADLSEMADALNGAIERINRMTAETQRKQEPAWGTGQAVGEPDTMSPGDQRTAWAPASADGGTEWLQLGYEKPVEVAQVRVRQTCGAGCVARVAAILESGAEVVIWQGRESASDGIVDAPFNAPAGLTARGIKVYLDTARVPGWNEIDAVELIGRDGSHQWAKTASASSSYGSNFSGDTDTLSLESTIRRLR